MRGLQGRCQLGFLILTLGTLSQTCRGLSIVSQTDFGTKTVEMFILSCSLPCALLRWCCRVQREASV